MAGEGQRLDHDQRQKLVEQGKELKEKLSSVEVKLGSLEAALQEEGQKLPNSTHPDVNLSTRSY